jgi:hypothetical protein
VHLDDFRKRRAEVLEQKERASSGTLTPQDGYVDDAVKRSSLEVELICKAQGLDAETHLQEKAEASWQGKAFIWRR